MGDISIEKQRAYARLSLMSEDYAILGRMLLYTVTRIRVTPGNCAKLLRTVMTHEETAKMIRHINLRIYYTWPLVEDGVLGETMISELQDKVRNTNTLNKFDRYDKAEFCDVLESRDILATAAMILWYTTNLACIMRIC